MKFELDIYKTICDLPDERVISELSKRVCGTVQYMMSYVTEISIPNWLAYGFKTLTGTRCTNTLSSGVAEPSLRNKFG